MSKFIYRGTDYIKIAFSRAIRAAYSAQTFFPLFKYTEDSDSKIAIYDNFPNRPLKAPTIVVSTGTGDLNRTTLDTEDLIKEDSIAEFTAWGRFNCIANIQILTMADRDRNKLTDLTALFCRHLFVNKFASFGIGYKEIKIAGEKVIEWQNQVLYTNSINIPCYTEFQVNYPIELLDVINKINITVDTEI